MSFMGRTLYPHGAFMICETTAEFDANVEFVTPDTAAMPTPVEPNNPTPDEVTQQANFLQQYLEKHGHDEVDPVTKTSQKLGEMYHGLVEPLLRMDLSVNGQEEVAEKAELISSSATIIVETLTKMITKARAMEKLFCNCGNSYELKAIKDNIGLLIKNKAYLKRMGYDKIAINIPYHPFFDDYTIRRAVATLVSASNELLDKKPLDMETIRIWANAEGSDGYFVDLHDMFTTLFDDFERRLRQETIRQHVEELDCIIKWDMTNSIHAVAVGEGPGDPMYDPVLSCNILNYFSVTLRNVKQSMYNLQCELLESEGTAYIDPDKTNPALYQACAQIHNMFAIATLYLMLYAYRANAGLIRKQAGEKYIKSVKTALRA